MPRARGDAFENILSSGKATADQARERPLVGEMDHDELAALAPASMDTPPEFDFEVAPAQERAETFSSRLTPSRKRLMDSYVHGMKMRGWPVTQYMLMDVLVGLLLDEEVEPVLRARLQAAARR